MLLLLPSPTNHQKPNLLIAVQESEDQLVSAHNTIPVLRRHKRLEDDQCFHPLDRKVGIYPDGADPGMPGDLQSNSAYGLQAIRKTVTWEVPKDFQILSHGLKRVAPMNR
jgi:hypothetical protein